jgi:hypothetical protein
VTVVSSPQLRAPAPVRRAVQPLLGGRFEAVLRQHARSPAPALAQVVSDAEKLLQPQ